MTVPVAGPGLPAESVTTWPAVPSSVGAVRAHCRAWLRDEGLDAFEDCCLLIVSELATNAVVHAGTPFEVTVCRLLDGLLIRVHDGSSCLPRPVAAPARSAESGRGTYLVDLLSVEWGAFEDGDGGKATWALLAGADAGG